MAFPAVAARFLLGRPRLGTAEEDFGALLHEVRHRCRAGPPLPHVLEQAAAPPEGKLPVVDLEPVDAAAQTARPAGESAQDLHLPCGERQQRTRGQERAPKGLEPGALGKHHEGRGRQLLAQGSQQGLVARHPPDDQHPPKRTLSLLQEGDPLVRRTLVQGAQDVLRGRLTPVELVGDVGLAVHGAARGQRNDLAARGAANRLVEAEPHPPELLDQELAAARRAPVVREDVDDPAAVEDVDEEGLSAQGGDGVEAAVDLAEGPLDGGRLGDVPHPSRNAEGGRGPELGLLEQLLQGLLRAALVGPHPGLDPSIPEGDHLNRECANVHAHETHRGDPGSGCPRSLASLLDSSLTSVAPVVHRSPSRASPRIACTGALAKEGANDDKDHGSPSPRRRGSRVVHHLRIALWPRPSELRGGARAGRRVVESRQEAAHPERPACG